MPRLALVWRTGQASPIHGHQAWCVVGMVEGRLRAESYRQGADGILEKDSEADCNSGATCVEMPSDADIHRLSNPYPATAISLHIYGSNLARDPASINKVYERELWRGAAI